MQTVVTKYVKTKTVLFKQQVASFRMDWVTNCKPHREPHYPQIFFCTRSEFVNIVSQNTEAKLTISLKIRLDNCRQELPHAGS